MRWFTRERHTTVCTGCNLNRVSTHSTGATDREQAALLTCSVCVNMTQIDGWRTSRGSQPPLCVTFFFFFGPKIEQQRCVSAVLTLLVRETAEDNQRRTNDVLQIPPLCDLWPTPYCGPGLLHVVVTLRPWCKWHRTKRIVHYQKNGVNIWNKYFLFRFKNKRVSSV